MITATKEHRDLVIQILVDAFIAIETKNSINLIVEQGPNRQTKMTILMGYLFDTAMAEGVVYLSENRKACVVLSFSNKRKLTFAKN